MDPAKECNERRLLTQCLCIASQILVKYLHLQHFCSQVFCRGERTSSVHMSVRLFIVACQWYDKNLSLCPFVARCSRKFCCILETENNQICSVLCGGLFFLSYILVVGFIGAFGFYGCCCCCCS